MKKNVGKLYRPALVYLYPANLFILRNVHSLFLPRPLLLRRPHFFIYTYPLIHFLFHISVFLCYFSHLKTNNNLVFALHPISYCTFMTFNFTTFLSLFLQTLSLTSTESSDSTDSLLSFCSIWHSGSHPFPGNIFPTWLFVGHGLLVCLLTNLVVPLSHSLLLIFSFL